MDNENSPVFDCIGQAHKALDAGASAREVVQRFAVHIVHERRLAELDALLAAFDQWTGRGALLDWLTTVLDAEYIPTPPVQPTLERSGTRARTTKAAPDLERRLPNPGRGTRAGRAGRAADQ